MHFEHMLEDYWNINKQLEMIRNPSPKCNFKYSVQYHLTQTQSKLLMLQIQPCKWRDCSNSSSGRPSFFEELCLQSLGRSSDYEHSLLYTFVFKLAVSFYYMQGRGNKNEAQLKSLACAYRQKIQLHQCFNPTLIKQKQEKGGNKQFLVDTTPQKRSPTIIAIPHKGPSPMFQPSTNGSCTEGLELHKRGSSPPQ